MIVFIHGMSQGLEQLSQNEMKMIFSRFHLTLQITRKSQF